MDPLGIFVATAPGLEPLLAEEAADAGFAAPRAIPGGIEIDGGWPEVWRAGLHLAGATGLLVRVAEFRAFHLAQLDKRARKLSWTALLPPGCAVKVEATCRRSKIYHGGAASQRIARAAAEALGAPQAEEAEGDTPVRLLARIEDDLVTLSLDAGGGPLHRRGLKSFVGKAPLREPLAALFLRACGWTGQTPLVDPMCGSGTILLEAGARAAGLAPGRARAFAFERLPSADPAAIAALRAGRPGAGGEARIFGQDRDDGAIRGAGENLARAGLSDRVTLVRQAISDLAPPPGPPGLVLTNPPYGGRIGAKGPLHALYGAFGARLKERFSGWSVGIVTSEPGLARTTGLDFSDIGPPVPLGPLTVKLYRTGPLP